MPRGVAQEAEIDWLMIIHSTNSCWELVVSWGLEYLDLLLIDQVTLDKPLLFPGLIIVKATIYWVINIFKVLIYLTPHGHLTFEGSGSNFEVSKNIPI